MENTNYEQGIHNLSQRVAVLETRCSTMEKLIEQHRLKDQEILDKIAEVHGCVRNAANELAIYKTYQKATKNVFYLIFFSIMMFLAMDFKEIAKLLKGFIGGGP